ncbi:hypothetical protein ACIRYZ_19280 [Kitasatospora sp. NPDC101155]
MNAGLLILRAVTGLLARVLLHRAPPRGLFRHEHLNPPAPHHRSRKATP